MGIINTLIKTATWPAFNSFARAAQAPEAAQQKVWSEVRSVLDKASYWGATAKGRSLEEFPITDYETYRETLMKMQSERVSSLSGEEIIFWAESGGTSGPAKLFPLTRLFQRQFQRTMGPYLHANATRFPGFADQPVAYLAGLLPQKTAPSGIGIGYISGFNYQNIPSFLKKLYALPSAVFSDADSFQKWAPVYAAASDISALFAITPSMAEQFVEALLMDRERIWRLLNKNSRIPVSKTRLHQLEKSFSIENPSLKDLWPSLSVLGCWKTSSCALQLNKFERFLQGKTPVADAIYSATEGWTTVPIFGETGGVLHPSAHVVEFHDASTTVQARSLVKPWELEVGKEYEIFLTTAMGFVRYRLYDVLQCTGYWHHSPILEFRRKAGNQISLGSMRITENELISSLHAAGVALRGPYCYAPNKNGNGLVFLACDEWDLDVQKQAKVDAALRDLSPYYRNDIADGYIVPIQIHPLPKEHRLWHRQGHAQEKPRILVQEWP